MEKLWIGCHVSFTKDTQLLGSLKEALSYGADTFMFYTGAPQNTNRAPIDEEITRFAHRAFLEEGVDPSKILVHAPYIINLANPKNMEFSIRFLREEIERVERLGLSKLVLHPGSHVGLGEEEGLRNIISALNAVIDSQTKVDVCIETMAGKGTECGKTFEQIQTIIEGVVHKEKVKVCLDTCHISDAGYDVTDVDKVLHTFDQVIGLSKLACLHINDSKNDRSSHKDRHENIGYGTIGFETLLAFIYHPKLKGIPKILETPYVSREEGSKGREYPPYKWEIEMIRSQKWNSHLLEDIRSDYK